MDRSYMKMMEGALKPKTPTGEVEAEIEILERRIHEDQLLLIDYSIAQRRISAGQEAAATMLADARKKLALLTAKAGETQQ